jgi:alpha-ribazole phosphatase
MDADMTTLYLIRHGRTDWNDAGRYQGQADPPLNAQGRAQARALAQALRSVPFDAIYSSDLARAHETAQALAEVTGLSVQLDPRLREIHQGEWEGLLASEIQARYPALWEQWHRAPLTVRLPGGETLQELEARFTAALDDISAAHPEGTVAVFLHKIAIALLRCRIRGLSLNRFWEVIPDNAAWDVVTWPLSDGIQRR